MSRAGSIGNTFGSQPRGQATCARQGGPGKADLQIGPRAQAGLVTTHRLRPSRCLLLRAAGGVFSNAASPRRMAWLRAVHPYMAAWPAMWLWHGRVPRTPGQQSPPPLPLLASDPTRARGGPRHSGQRKVPVTAGTPWSAKRPPELPATP